MTDQGDALILALLNQPPADRITLARALVADMPGVVVAEVPEEARWINAPNPDLDDAATWALGFNTLRAIILAQKEPKK